MTLVPLFKTWALASGSWTLLRVALMFQQPGPVTLPVRFTEPQGYWSITRYQTLEPRVGSTW